MGRERSACVCIYELSSEHAKLVSDQLMVSAECCSVGMCVGMVSDTLMVAVAAWGKQLNVSVESAEYSCCVCTCKCG